MPSSVKVNGESAAARRKRHQQDGPADLGSTFTRRRFNPSTGNTRADQNHALLKQERDALDQHRQQQEQQQQAEEQAALEDQARTRLLRRTGREPDEAAVEAEVEAMREEGVVVHDDDQLGATTAAVTCRRTCSTEPPSRPLHSPPRPTMNKQKLKKRKSKAQAARRDAQRAADDAFAAYLDDGTDESLNAFSTATAKADALGDAVQKITAKIEAAETTSYTPSSRSQQPYDHAEHQRKRRQYMAKLNELAAKYERAAGVQAASYDDVKEWAERTGRPVPEEPAGIF